MTSTPRKSWPKIVAAAAIPMVFFAFLEVAARAEFRWRHGYPYSQALAYVPHPDLVYRLNPDHYEWRQAGRKPPFDPAAASTEDPRPRVWVLGGSTSEAHADRTEWPATLQKRIPSVHVINSALSGYGTSQMTWLYRTYEQRVKPEAVIVYEGWNGRGAITSAYGWRPANAPSRYDTVGQALSERMVNVSALYGRLWNVIDANRSSQCHGPAQPPDELKEWAREYEGLAREIAKSHPVYLVVFPGLAMRDDARPVLTPSLHCVEQTWSAQRTYYETQVASIREIAARLGLQPLDATLPYQGLSAKDHVSLFVDAVHQTAQGNEILGNAIADALIDRGLAANQMEKSF